MSTPQALQLFAPYQANIKPYDDKLPKEELEKLPYLGLIIKEGSAANRYVVVFRDTANESCIKILTIFENALWWGQTRWTSFEAFLKSCHANVLTPSVNPPPLVQASSMRTFPAIASDPPKPLLSSSARTITVALPGSGHPERGVLKPAPLKKNVG